MACHLHIWVYGYFSGQSWFWLVLHPAQHFSWCSLYIYGCNYDYPQILISCLNNFWEWRLLYATIHSTLPTGHFMKSSNITCLKLSLWCPATAPPPLLLLLSSQFWLFPQPRHLEPLILFQVVTTIHPLEWLNKNEKKKDKKDNRKHWYDAKETWKSHALLMGVKLLQFILKYIWHYLLNLNISSNSTPRNVSNNRTCTKACFVNNSSIQC